MKAVILIGFVLSMMLLTGCGNSKKCKEAAEIDYRFNNASCNTFPDTMLVYPDCGCYDIGKECKLLSCNEQKQYIYFNLRD